MKTKGVVVIGMTQSLYAKGTFSGINAEGKKIELAGKGVRPSIPGTTTQPAAPQFNPGLAAVNVHGNFTQKRFALEEIFTMGRHCGFTGRRTLRIVSKVLPGATDQHRLPESRALP